MLLVAGTTALLLLCIPTSKEKLSRIPKEAALLLATSLYAAALTFLSWGSHANTSSFLAEGKLFILTLLAFALCYHSRSIGRIVSPHGMTNVLILINFIYFVGSGGEFRYIDKLPSGSVISIYMSVILAFAFILDHRRLPRILLFGFILLLGSSTGLVALLAGLAAQWTLSRSRIPTGRLILACLAVFILAVLLYFYTLHYRGRDLLDLASLDRFQLSYAGVTYIWDTLTFERFLFGYGVGADISDVIQYFPPNSSVLYWIKNSRAADGFTGLAFHNEYLRVFVNFGIIGTILIWWSIIRFLQTPALRWAIIFASLLNSTIYVTPIFVFAIIAELVMRSRKPNATTSQHHFSLPESRI